MSTMLRPGLLAATFAVAVALTVTVTAGRAEADTNAKVALLPLDAEARLAMYGKPVAAEIARALIAGGLEIMVATNMTVPDQAVLVIDGSIKSKAGAIIVSLRIRDPHDGTTIDRLEATAQSLTAIDRASADIASQALPVIRHALEAQRTAHPPDPIVTRPPDRNPDRQPTLTLDNDPLMLVGVGITPRATLMGELLRKALGVSVPQFVRQLRRRPTLVELSSLYRDNAQQTVTASRASGALVFEVLSYEVAYKNKIVPVVQAKVRFRVVDATGVRFDRTLVTNSVVGEPNMEGAALAQRVADEVIRIARPQLVRSEPTWR